jgi:hypothetical protein
MNHVLKSIFVNLILTIAFTTAFSQDPIEITYDSNANTLKLSDGGITYVNWVNRRHVTWYTNDPYISSFQIVKKLSTRWDIFDNPQSTPARNYPAHVRGIAHLGIWNYSIKWYHLGQPQPEYDPKIAVKAIGSDHAVLISLVLIFLITSISLSSKLRSTKAKLSNAITELAEAKAALAKNNQQNDI